MRNSDELLDAKTLPPPPALIRVYGVLSLELLLRPRHTPPPKVDIEMSSGNNLRGLELRISEIRDVSQT
jgi:hypothetical protein